MVCSRKRSYLWSFLFSHFGLLLDFVLDQCCVYFCLYYYCKQPNGVFLSIQYTGYNLFRYTIYMFSISIYISTVHVPICYLYVIVCIHNFALKFTFIYFPIHIYSYININMPYLIYHIYLFISNFTFLW